MIAARNLKTRSNQTFDSNATYSPNPSQISITENETRRQDLRHYRTLSCNRERARVRAPVFLIAKVIEFLRVIGLILDFLSDFASRCCFANAGERAWLSLGARNSTAACISTMLSSPIRFQYSCLKTLIGWKLLNQCNSPSDRLTLRARANPKLRNCRSRDRAWGSTWEEE